MKNLIIISALFLSFYSCEQSPENIEQSPSNIEEPPCDNGTFVGDVILLTQQEVDSFGLLCYSKIEGKLIIGDIDYDALVLGDEPSNIVSISSLNSITEITDALIFSGCPLLQDLEGLNNLTSIGNALRFRYCESLASLEQLSNLDVTNNEFDFVFAWNDALVNLHGLEGLMGMRTIDLRYMNGLENLQGLNNLQFLERLDLGWNFSLINLEGINNVETLLGIGISFCSELETLEAINSNHSLVYMDLGFNPELSSLSGMESSINLNMDFVRVSHTNLESLAFLSSVESVAGLDVDSNSNLLNLQGLGNISEVSSAHITENLNLNSLEGLENLIQVNTQLNILENDNLEDHCSTQNLFINGSYINVQIENNAYNPTIQDIINGNCSQ